jgi:pimeloyl-ACP methyl ester carboxylesterase
MQTLSLAVPIEHTTISTNGIRLHVVQAGPADGTPVILLHGFPEFWYGWKHQIPALAEAGFRVYAPDQRGYNLSDKPSGASAYTLDQLMGDVIGLMDAIGQEKVYLVAHDWGAVVAWWTAIHHPQRLHKLVILNVPHPATMMRQLSGNPAQMLKSWYIGFFQIPALPESLLLANNAQAANDLFKRTSNRGSFSDEDIAAYRAAWQQPGAMTAMLNWYRALVQHRPAPPADRRVHVPTLILWGVNDVALRRELATDSLRYCDNGRIVWYENATHWVQHDEPAAINRELLSYMP